MIIYLIFSSINGPFVNYPISITNYVIQVDLLSSYWKKDPPDLETTKGSWEIIVIVVIIVVNRIVSHMSVPSDRIEIVLYTNLVILLYITRTHVRTQKFINLF